MIWLKETINEILQNNKKHAQANLVKAKLLLIDGKNSEALAILGVLLEENPNWGKAHYYKALAHFDRMELEMLNTSINEAMKLIPNDTKVHTLKARQLFLQGDFAGAMEEAKTALRLAPNNFTAALVLGQSQFAAKEYGDALKTAGALLQFQPDNVEALQAARQNPDGAAAD